MSTKNDIRRFYAPEPWDEPTEEQRVHRHWVCRTDCVRCGITMGFTVRKGPRPRYCPDCLEKDRQQIHREKHSDLPDCMILGQ